MSDLHYGQDTTKEKERLKSLAKWINEQNLNISLLLFTGDFVDAPSIVKECVCIIKDKYSGFPELNFKDQDYFNNVVKEVCALGDECIELYNQTSKEITLKKTGEVAELFKQFSSEIGVASRNIVLCCGNHDRLRLINHESSFNCANNRIDEDLYKESFEPYEQFCTILNDKLSYKTQLYTCGNLKFIIANSNWKTPINNESNNACINCGKVYDILDEVSKHTDYNRQTTFFVAHKPLDDICETAKFPYGGETFTVYQLIERTTSAFLYGDKHSYATKQGNKLQEYMCGKPISKDDPHYNLLDYEPVNGIKSCQFIILESNKWKLGPTADCMENIYSISKDSLKQYALELLSGNRQTYSEWNHVVELVNSTDSDRMKYVSEMFMAYVDFKGDVGKLGNDKEELIFDYIINLISCCTQKQAFGIKGEPSGGKSTLINITYLKMLQKFYEGKLKALPFLFNMERMLGDYGRTRDINEYYENCINRFSEFLKKCLAYSNDYKLPVWIIIDGLQKSDFFDPRIKTIEKRIYEILETSLDNKLDRYIMVLDSHDDFQFVETFEKIRDFEFVLFVNKARMIAYKDGDSKHIQFLRNYYKLLKKELSDDELNRIIRIILKFDYPTISMGFLHYFYEDFESINADANTLRVLVYYIEKLEVVADKKFSIRSEVMQKVAGLLYSDQLKFFEILGIEGLESVSVNDLYTLLSDPLLLNYLIAKNYASEFNKYAQLSDPLPDNSILRSFVPYDLTLLIRVLINKNGKKTHVNLERFINYHKSEIKGYLYSMMAYLCGHLMYEDTVNLLQGLPQVGNNDDLFTELCQRRSLYLAKVASSDDSFSMSNLLLKLMDDEEFRRFNRSFQLHYFRDRSINSLNTRKSWNYWEKKYWGFDFRFTFLIYYLKLYQYLSKRRSYPLLEYDLFTLCDLVYSRLLDFSESSLFYSVKYNRKNDSICYAILSKVTELLKMYNHSLGRRKQQDKRVAAYFMYMFNELGNIKEQVHSNEEKTPERPYISPLYDFKKICDMKRFIRVGWEIQKYDEDGIIVKDQPRNQFRRPANYPKETLMEYVLETVYIAMMFLPETASIENYSKYKIISILLYSELGKTSIGDHAPQYSNHIKLNASEEAELSEFLTKRALDQFSNLTLFFTSIRNGKLEDINYRIAWEIKMIQMEYKYYSLYDQLSFTKKRRDNFEDEFAAPSVEICKNIRNTLIVNNPDFQKYMNTKLDDE